MTNEERHQQALDRYNANIKHCLNCNKPLTYEQRDQTFCSLSCSSAYNGRKSCNLRLGLETHHFSEEERKERSRLRAAEYYRLHKCGTTDCVYCGNSFTKTNRQQTVCPECREKINSYKKISEDIEYHRTSDHSTVHRHTMKQLGWDVGKSDIVHHIDGNKRNNDPGNLILLSIRDHVKLHQYIATERFKGATKSLFELAWDFIVETETPYGYGCAPDESSFDS